MNLKKEVYGGIEMQINERGLALIKSFEGYQSKPYKLAGEPFWTVGYGHHSRDVDPKKEYTTEECEKLLLADLKRFEDHVTVVDYAGGYFFNENEFSALVSFAYNCGNINGLTNHAKRDREQIRKAMLKYCYDSAGNLLKGLERRRKAELELFNTPVEAADWLYDSLGEIR